MSDNTSGSEHDEVPEASGSAVHEEDQSVLGRVNADLAAVDHALERLDAGTYGICQICGHAISDDHLEATPTATLCADHRDVPEIGGAEPSDPLDAGSAEP